jgi:hypothetical protein
LHEDYSGFGDIIATVISTSFYTLILYGLTHWWFLSGALGFSSTDIKAIWTVFWISLILIGVSRSQYRYRTTKGEIQHKAELELRKNFEEVKQEIWKVREMVDRIDRKSR